MTEYTENGLPIVTRTTIDKVLEDYSGDKTVQETNYWAKMQNDNPRLYDALERRIQNYIDMGGLDPNKVFRPCAYLYAFLTEENEGSLLTVSDETLREVLGNLDRPETGEIQRYANKLIHENEEAVKALMEGIRAEGQCPMNSMGICTAVYASLDREYEKFSEAPN